MDIMAQLNHLLWLNVFFAQKNKRKCNDSNYNIEIGRQKKYREYISTVRPTLLRKNN